MDNLTFNMIPSFIKTLCIPKMTAADHAAAEDFTDEYSKVIEKATKFGTEEDLIKRASELYS